jgi:hypothetical protein
MSSGRRDGAPTVVAVTTDLLARARLEDAAARAGWDLHVTRPESLADALGRGPDVVVLDLDAGGAGLLDAIAAARAAGLVPDALVGFVSHVDRELTTAATAAGVKVMPRGKFWRSLADVVTPGR